MSENHERQDQRVLVLAPAGKDGRLTRDILAKRGVVAIVCRNVDVLCHEWAHGAGALLIAEEALDAVSLERLGAALAGQPAWSDVPVLIFVHGPATGTSLDRLGVLRNITVLERPIRVPALASTVNAALRARIRQYEVRDLMRELRDASRAKDDFIAMVSHELRTPLNVIRGMSRSIVQKSVAADRLAAAIEMIDRNAEILCRLVDDLLDLSRLQNRRFQLNVAAVSLAEVIDRVVTNIRPTADVKRVGLVVDVEPPPTPVLGDATRLQQVLANLLTNAVKFTPADGTVTLRLRSTTSHAVITVRDTGEGIDPELLPHVFEPFRQGRVARHGGLGLGLAIVRQFVELHGGAISARSDGPGRGAEFTVRLPLQPLSSSVAV
jgi:signal transduction histidine kinase